MYGTLPWHTLKRYGRRTKGPCGAASKLQVADKWVIQIAYTIPHWEVAAHERAAMAKLQTKATLRWPMAWATSHTISVLPESASPAAGVL